MYTSLYPLLRRCILPGGRDISRALRMLEQSQWLSRAELDEYHLIKIQNLVAYAYKNVPFYRSLYQRAGCHPGDIKSLKDFQSFPCITRDDVITNRAELVSRNYAGAVFEDSTGGSTGRPMRFTMDRATALWSNAVETRYRGWYGVKPGDKRAWVWGALKDFPQWRVQDRLAAYVKRYRYLNAHTMSEKNMAAFAAMLLAWQPAMFRAYPSTLSLFAHYLDARRITGIRPKLIETSAEKLTAAQRAHLTRVFNCPIAEHYSSWEIYDIAYQCPEGSLHVSEDRYLELVENDKPAACGHTGEVVITALNQYAMPFIRYKNADLGIYAEKPCSCGRCLPVLQDLVGRMQEVLFRPDGRIVNGSIMAYIMHNRPEVSQFQAFQPDTTHIEVRLVCQRSMTPEGRQAPAAARTGRAAAVFRA